MATFRKLKSGNWQARVSQDGKEFSIGTYKTKKEAEIQAAKAEERIYYGQTLNDKNKKFEDVVHEWLTHKKNDLKDSTFKQYNSVAKTHILPFFGHFKLMNVKRPTINTWLNKHLEDGYSKGARVRYLMILRNIFHYAVYEMEYLEKDPTTKLRVPVKDSAGEEKEVKYYSLDELNKLLDFMESYRHQRFKEYQLYLMLIDFLSQTGLRISEALALRWSDLTGDKLKVERQTSRDDNNQLILTSLKNSSSYRTIKLDGELVKKLRKFQMLQNEMILKYPAFKKNKDNIIFQNSAAKYLTPSTVREMFVKYCKKAGVPYKGTHVFRHTHAVLLLEAGANIKYVSKRLGHKSIKTTADVYLDITDKMEDEELQKFTSHIKR